MTSTKVSVIKVYKEVSTSKEEAISAQKFMATRTRPTV